MLRKIPFLTLIMSANLYAQSSVVLKPKTAVVPVLMNPTVWSSEGTGAVSRSFYHPENLYVGGLTSTSLNIVGDCQKDQSFTMSPQQRKNVNLLSAPIEELQCKEANKFRQKKELNQETCILMSNCFKSRLRPGDDQYFTILSDAKEKTAAEAISLITPTTIDLLYNLEELKAYAVNKYDSSFLPVECTEEDSLVIPDPDKSFCRTDLIDRGFEIAQKNCNLVDVGCKLDYLDFIQNKKVTSGKTSLMADYLKMKTSKSSKLLSHNDEAITREIAEIMSNTAKTPLAIAEDVLQFLSKNISKLDPIYKSYILQSLKSKRENVKDEIKEGFIKYISSNYGKKTNEILVELDMLRKKEAKSKLAGECKRVMSLPKLCNLVKDVLNGAEVQVPKIAFEKMIKREDLSTKKKNSSLTSQELADNVSRCSIFSIETGAGKIELPVRLSKGFDLFSREDNSVFFVTDALAQGASNSTRSPANRSQIIVKANGEISKKEMINSLAVEKLNSTKEDKVTDSVFVASFAQNRVMQDPIRSDLPAKGLSSNQTPIKQEMFDSSKSLTAKDDIIKTAVGKNTDERTLAVGNQMQIQQMPSSGLVSRNVPPSDGRSQNSLMVDSNELIDKKIAPDKVVQSPDYTNLMSKISSLEERLAAAQKKSTTVAEAPASSTVEVKEAEESELARELRIAKATLADMNKSKLQEKLRDNSNAGTDAKAGRVKVASESSSDEDYSDDRSVISSQGSISKDSRSSAPSVAQPTAGSASVGGNSDVRTPAGIDKGGEATLTRNSGAIAGNGADSSLGDGIVLTRLDGNNRAKVSEMISKMIIAESGKPFFIEEGGLVKEVIPELVDGVLLKSEDGSPLYKVVVKGKVGEFKVGAKDKKVKKDQLPKVASPADLKFQDYNSINSPAVRYKELQDIFKSKKN